MCGFAGIYRPDGGPGVSRELLEGMTGAIRHRGPDDAGFWVDPEAGVGLGFRRLSILDLTPEGHQPMASATGRYWILCNGEIDNVAALRGQLEEAGHGFRGHSDTEVILAAVTEWGVRDAVARFNGMFAIALWDRLERRLHLVRDRLGKKPLYYGWQGGTFLFGSELKALAAHPAFRGEVDQVALAQYLQFGFVPGEASIHRGIRKLGPGCLLGLGPGARDGGLPEPYWEAGTQARAGRAARFGGTDLEAGEALLALLRDAVGLRLVADVPVGAFLSGGIDSSLVVALMQEQSSRPVRSFSIGFREARFDEAGPAAAVARHLGTDHTELLLGPGQAQAVIPLLGTLYDEPFADPSQIATYLVARLARQDVTVALSGDGGDELFGGYHRHVLGPRLLARFGRWPRPLLRLGERALLGLSPEAWERLLRPLEACLPRRVRGFVTGDRLHKLAGLLTAAGPQAFHRQAITHWASPPVLAGGDLGPALAVEPGAWEGDPAEAMMLLDLVTYLPDDVLVKVDRATMAVSLEARAPLLDYRLAEFAWTLPPSLKIRQGQGKWLLRQVLDQYMPRELIDRPKTSSPDLSGAPGPTTSRAASTANGPYG